MKNFHTLHNRHVPSFYQYFISSFLYPKNVSKLIQGLLFWITHLQVIAILLWVQLSIMIRTKKHDFFSNYIQKISEVIATNSLISLFQESSDNTFLVLLVWGYMAGLFAIVLGIIIKFKLGKAISKIENAMIVILSQFHLSFVFWVITLVLVQDLSVSLTFEKFLIGEKAQGVINLTLIIINIIFTLFIAAFSYNPCRSSSIYSTHTSLHQILIFIAKLSSVPFIWIHEYSDLSVWIFTILTLIILLGGYFYQIWMFPYYQYTTQRLSMILSSVSLLIASFSFFILIMQDLISISELLIVYLEFVLLPLIIKISDLCLENTIQSFIGRIDDEIDSEARAIKKIFSLNYFMKKTVFYNDTSASVQELRLLGSLCSYLEEESLETKNLNASVKDKIRNQLLSNFCQRLNHNKKIRFILADYIIEQNGNLAIAINYLVEISKQKSFLSPSANKALNELEIMMHEHCKNSKDDYLNIKAFVDFDSISVNFVERIYANITRFIDFWDLYKKPKFELMELLKKSLEIENEDNKIVNIWTKHIDKQKLFASSLADFYATYLLLVRNVPFLALKVKEKYKPFSLRKQQVLSSSEMASSPDDITLTVSMAKAKVGKVLHVSANITKVLGWTQYDLVGKSVDTLQMPFMREQHMQVMTKHLVSISSSSVLNHVLDVFVLNKDNRILPCSIYVSIHPYIQEELKYTAIIRIKSSNQKVLILNQNGDIEVCTTELGDQLDLVKNKRYNIVDICGYVQDIDLPGRETVKLTSSDGCCVSETISSLKKQTLTNSNYISYDKDSWKIKLSSNNVWTRIRAWQNKEFLIMLKMSINKPLAQQGLDKYLAVLTLQNIGEQIFYILELKTWAEQESDSESLEEQKEDAINDSADIPDERYASLNNKMDTNAKNGLEQTEPTAFETTERLNSCSPLFKNPKRTTLRVVTIKSAKEKRKSEQIENVEVKIMPKKKAPAQIRNLNVAASSTYSTVTKLSASVEEAVYQVPENSSIKVLNLMGMLLITITIIFLIVFKEKNSQTMTKVGDLVTLISASTMQLLVYIEYNRLCKIFSFSDWNIFSLERFAWANIPDARIIGLIRLSIENDNLIKYSATIRNGLHLLDNEALEIVYKKFSVIDWDPITKSYSSRETNSMNFATEIVAKGKELSSAPPQNITSENRDISFFLNNTGGEILQVGESFTNVLLQNTKDQIINLCNLLTTFISITAVISLVFIGYLLMIERTMIIDRGRLLEIFLKFEEGEIQKRIDLVLQFRSILQRNNMDVRNLEFEESYEEDDQQKRDHKRQTEAKVKISSFANQRRAANKKNMNRNLIKITLNSLFIVSLLFVGFTGVKVVFDTQNQVINTKIDMMVDSNLNYYEFGVLILETFEYISSNASSTMRGRPVKHDWEQTFMKVSELQAKLIKVTDKEEGLGGNNELVDIIKGDLCNILVSDPYAGAQCASLIYGFVRKGIVQITSFMMSVIQRAKQTFDNSNKTISEMFKILSEKDLVQSEPVWAMYMLPGYQLIDQLIREQLAHDLETYSEALTVVLSLFAAAFFLLGIFLWWTVKAAFARETNGWRKMIRLVPDNIVVTNKMLKGYLMSNSNFVLS